MLEIGLSSLSVSFRIFYIVSSIMFQREKKRKERKMERKTDYFKSVLQEKKENVIIISTRN